MWGGPPVRAGPPVPLFELSTDSHQADEGVGRGPGGPPHRKHGRPKEAVSPRATPVFSELRLGARGAIFMVTPRKKRAGADPCRELLTEIDGLAGVFWPHGHADPGH